MSEWVRTRNSFHTGHSGAQDRNKFESMQSKGENLLIAEGARSEALQGPTWASSHKHLQTLAYYI